MCPLAEGGGRCVEDKISGEEEVKKVRAKGAGKDYLQGPWNHSSV